MVVRVRVSCTHLEMSCLSDNVPSWSVEREPLQLGVVRVRVSCTHLEMSCLSDNIPSWSVEREPCSWGLLGLGLVVLTWRYPV